MHFPPHPLPNLRSGLKLVALAALCLVTGAIGGRAQETAPRASLAKGWQTGADLAVEAGTALSGGATSKDSLNGLVLVRAEWSGGSPEAGSNRYSAFVSALGLVGVGPTETFARNLMTVSSIEGRRSVRLYSWWFQARSGIGSVRAGALLADDEFATTDTGANFLNSAFGWPAFLSSNTVSTGPAFYVPALGIRARLDFAGSAYFQAGCYDGDTFAGQSVDEEIRHHGLRYDFGGHHGYFLVAEGGWSPAPGRQLKAGAWLHTAHFDNVFADDAGASFALSGNAPRRHRGNYGAYVSIEQTLTGEAEKPGHAAVHFRLGASPDDRNMVAWAADAGFAWVGPFPNRPDDVLSLGLARATLSSPWSRSQLDAQPGIAKPDFEEVAELGYSAALGDNRALRPSLQYIRHPGGSLDTRDAVVALLRFEAGF